MSNQSPPPWLWWNQERSTIMPLPWTRVNLVPPASQSASNESVLLKATSVLRSTVGRVVGQVDAVGGIVEVPAAVAELGEGQEPPVAPRRVGRVAGGGDEQLFVV